MLTPQIFTDSFERNLHVIRLQTAGLSQADSLVQLPFRANCLNWVLGHLATNRCAVLRLLEAEAPDLAAQVARVI